MTLPGKLAIGFLQEDNPVKSYFRVQPLIVKDEGEAKKIETARDDYPDDGFIRIVPDKNEIGHFKSRMFTLGKYCLIDLRAHPNENDKIRPNKNYGGADGDANTHIIYSDVVRELPPLLAAEVYDTGLLSGEVLNARPGTKYIALTADGSIEGMYTWARRDDEGVVIARAESLSSGAEARTFAFDLSGAEVTLLTGFENSEARQEAASDPQGAEADSAASSPPEPAPITPPANTKALPTATRTRAEESGAYIRRGRSIHEIVEEHWRHSRLDQLGHPVPPNASSNPALSPAEKLKAALVEAISAMGGVSVASIIDSSLEGALKPARDRFDALAGDKIKLAADIDRLSADRRDAQDDMRRELLDERAKTIGQLEKRISQLDDILKRKEDDSRTAQGALAAAEQSIERVLGDSLDQRMADSLLEGRARDILLTVTSARRPQRSFPSARDISGEELIELVAAYLVSYGLNMERDEVINLLACAHLSSITLISGPTGSGKSAAVRALAAALGLFEIGRYAEVRPGAGGCALLNELYTILPSGLPIERLPRVGEVLKASDGLAPSILLLDDANTAPIEAYVGELMEVGEPGFGGVISTAGGYMSVNPQLRIFMTLREDGEGYPVTARLMDRAFMLRLSAPGPAADFSARPNPMPPAEEAVSCASLSGLFAGGRGIPAGIAERFRELREGLAVAGILLSRRAVTDVNMYLNAVIPHMSAQPIRALDYAVSQRVIPAILASAGYAVLERLPGLLADLPMSAHLMDCPLPLPQFA